MVFNAQFFMLIGKNRDYHIRNEGESFIRLKQTC